LRPLPLGRFPLDPHDAIRWRRRRRGDAHRPGDRRHERWLSGYGPRPPAPRDGDRIPRRARGSMPGFHRAPLLLAQEEGRVACGVLSRTTRGGCYVPFALSVVRTTGGLAGRRTRCAPLTRRPTIRPAPRRGVHWAAQVTHPLARGGSGSSPPTRPTGRTRVFEKERTTAGATVSARSTAEALKICSRLGRFGRAASGGRSILSPRSRARGARRKRTPQVAPTRISTTFAAVHGDEEARADWFPR